MTYLGHLEGLLLLHGTGVAADPAVDLVAGVDQHHIVVIQILREREGAVSVLRGAGGAVLVLRGAGGAVSVLREREGQCQS